MNLIFHPEAYEEMLESARFFEEKDAGLGFDLTDAIQESINRIIKFPLLGSIERRNIRKCLVRGFPFTSSTKRIQITSSLLPSCISIVGRVTGPSD
jgi:hypothetical protein